MKSEQLKDLTIKALEDLKAKQITALDVRNLTDMTDFMIIASGTSNRHVKSLANNVVVEAKKAGARQLGMEGEGAADWVLVDFGDVIVHVMLPETRQFYDLERLWSSPSSINSSAVNSSGNPSSLNDDATNESPRPDDAH